MGNWKMEIRGFGFRGENWLIKKGYFTCLPAGELVKEDGAVHSAVSCSGQREAVV